MRSRSTLRARSLYNDRINRNSPGLIPSNGACYPCAGAMLFLLKMMTTGGPENPSHTPQGGGSRPEASSIETRQG